MRVYSRDRGSIAKFSPGLTFEFLFMTGGSIVPVANESCSHIVVDENTVAEQVLDYPRRVKVVKQEVRRPLILSFPGKDILNEIVWVRVIAK